MDRMIQLMVLLCIACCSAQLVPYHVYLSLTGDLTQMQLTFSTSSWPPSATLVYWPVLNPGNKVQILADSSDTHEFTDPFNHTDYITTLTLSSLQYATEYGYSIAPNASMSPTAYFVLKTLPAPEDPINVMLYGDMGTTGSLLMSNLSGGLHAWSQERKMDFIIHYGDLAYNLASLNGTLGDLFMRGIQNISASMPYTVVAGNHEYSDDHHDEALFRGWFSGQVDLGVQSGSADPLMWHSYDIGDKLHFIGINTEVYCEDNSHAMAQWYWLLKDLTMVRLRPVQPWIVVYGHRQMYLGNLMSFHSKLMRLGFQCTDAGLQNCNFSMPCYSGVNCAFSLESLFQQFKIDMFFAGHVHSYNRMFPIANDTMYETQGNNTYVNPQNPVYIVSGAAGTQHNITDLPPMQSRRATVNSTTPTFMSDAAFSFSFLTVYNNTHLQLQQIGLDNSVEDDLWIIKDSSQPAWTAQAPFFFMNTTEFICNQ